MEQFKDEVLKDIRSHGIKHTIKVLTGVVADELKDIRAGAHVTLNEWHLIRNMLEEIAEGPCERLQHPDRYGNRDASLQGGCRECYPLT